jgi:hypothetical protein
MARIKKMEIEASIGNGCAGLLASGRGDLGEFNESGVNREQNVHLDRRTMTPKAENAMASDAGQYHEEELHSHQYIDSSSPLLLFKAAATKKEYRDRGSIDYQRNGNTSVRLKRLWWCVVYSILLLHCSSELNPSLSSTSGKRANKTSEPSPVV